MRNPTARRAAGALLTLMTLLLSACLLAPGKFAAELDIRKDGRFTFSYAGEIHMLALSRLAAEMNEAKTFKPQTCFGGDDLSTERECTAEEIAEQKSGWEADQKSRAERNKRDAESMKAFLGGIDPSNPKAAEELAQRMRRQAGWRRVDYKGEGLFDVDFSIAGRVDHDFIFPTIERFPMANAFVQVALRNDGTVRVDAPGFAPAAGGEPFRGMAQGLGGVSGKDNAAGFPQVDGTFTLRTDGEILANNTDEGARPDPAGQRLDWAVNLRSPAAPTALIRRTRR